LLCSSLIDRNLYKIELQNTKFNASYIKTLQEKIMKKYKVSKKETEYFVFSDSVINSAYNSSEIKINILYNDGKLLDVAKASDQLNIKMLSKKVTKYFMCYPKYL
jgi:hypothetical protein